MYWNFYWLKPISEQWSVFLVLLGIHSCVRQNRVQIFSNIHSYYSDFGVTWTGHYFLSGSSLRSTAAQWDTQWVDFSLCWLEYNGLCLIKLKFENLFDLPHLLGQDQTWWGMDQPWILRHCEGILSFSPCKCQTSNCKYLDRFTSSSITFYIFKQVVL